MSISIRNASKTFGTFKALDDVSIEIKSGELLALLGPSGSGKTTLLRIIAGLEIPDAGQIGHDGKDITFDSARDRNIGFVFQHYALFRHMTVFENVAFGLRVRRRPNDEVKRRVDELLGLVRLDTLASRYPSQLSGGQRQRVALARALASQPKVLLLDEPFGALDAKVRTELRRWLRRIHEESHTTSIFVTHDQDEAFEVADQVVVMNKGRIEQTGTPRDIVEHPANSFVLDFVGNVNVFAAEVRGGQALMQNMLLDFPDYPHDEPKEASIYVRSHELEIRRTASGGPAFPAIVQRIHPAGAISRVGLLDESSGKDITVDLSRERFADLHLREGETVFVSPRRVRVFLPDFEI